MQLNEFQYNPHVHILPVTSADFLRKIYPQSTHSTRCNIRTSAYPHFTIGPHKGRPCL